MTLQLIPPTNNTTSMPPLMPKLSNLMRWMVINGYPQWTQISRLDDIHRLTSMTLTGRISGGWRASTPGHPWANWIGLPRLGHAYSGLVDL